MAASSTICSRCGSWTSSSSATPGSTHARGLGEIGRRFLLRQQPALEAQIANLADEIAYNHHDIDDGLRSGILELDGVRAHALFHEVLERSRREHAGLEGKRLIHTAIRTMLGAFVNDLIEATRARLLEAAPASVAEVRAHPRALADFSPGMRTEHVALKRLLGRDLYAHERVRRFTDRAHGIVADLFEAYVAAPRLLPVAVQTAAGDGPAMLARAVADYIAGMTDRYAFAEHGRVCGAAASAAAEPWTAV
jgi:dGTPase